MSDRLEYRRLRAPRRDGERFVDPPMSAVGELLERNLDQAAEYQTSIAGLPLVELRAIARSELVAAAQAHTGRYCQKLPAASGTDRILLAGHQPQLFHPGVWVKNFALGQLAVEHDATAVNLIIDNDTIPSAAIRVPTGSVDQPRVEAVPYDAPSREIPYEERSILDRNLWNTFAERAAETLAPLVADPLLRTYWPLVLQASAANNHLGEALAAGRHLLEAAWGNQTLEVPLSKICATDSFRRWVLHLCRELPTLGEIYNRSLAEYRQVHRLRSRSHPVPDLEQVGPLQEAPLWIWSTSAPRRRPLFVERRGDDLLLTNRADIELRLPADVAGAIAQLAAAESAGIKIRPRALVTTLYARLVLGDWFVHGIGGGKYDQLTDLLIARWLRLPAPAFQIISGTALLPIPHTSVSEADVTRMDQLARELRFHPEHHLDAATCQQPAVAQLLKRKRAALASDPPRGARKARHEEIAAVNAALNSRLVSERDRLQAERSRLVAAARHEAVFASREYAWCLYPEATLRCGILDLPAKEP